jgi:nucleoside-diphosphate-sugar epimerase
MKALVTGGGGFLGKAVVRQLLERGDNVRTTNRNTYPDLDKLGVEQVRGDIGIASDASKAVEGCDIVYHVAAKAGMWGLYDDYYLSNVVGTENIIKACREKGVGKLVYTSSPSVIFSGKDMQGVNESVPYPEKFLANYPLTKAMAERIVIKANDARLSTVSLRPHLIFGPGDNHLFPGIIKRAEAGRLLIVGTGKNLIDLVYVDNAARAHLQAGDKLYPGSAVAGKVYFISNGEPITLEDSFNKIMKIIGKPPVTRHLNAKLAYYGGAILETIYGLLRIKSDPLVTRFIAHELSSSHWFDISAAKKDFGYNPSISIDEGFRILGEYYKEHGW